MNTIIFTQQAIAARSYAALTILSLLLSAFPAGFFVAEASVSAGVGADKVTICHWDEGHGGKFQLVSANKTADANGHAGPSHHDSKDIIPEFDYAAHGQTPAGHFDGQNLDYSYGNKTGAEWLAEGKCPPTTGEITIAKVAGNDTETLFDFTGDLDNFQLTGGSDKEFKYLQPGSYLVTESDSDEWELLDVTCNGEQSNDTLPSVTIDLKAGDDVTCLFTNRPKPQDPVYGCMDPDATNYDENATEPGDVQCEYPEPEPPELCAYAGKVIDYTDPAYKNGGAMVDANRRLIAAVEAGVAPYSNFFGKEENDWQVDPLDFFSLGIEGYLVYEFTDAIVVDQPGDDIAIWEITGGTATEQTDEKVKVFVSENGSDYVYVDTLTGDGTVDIDSAGLAYVKYVKLVDDSVGIQGSNGDGFDVDAISIIDGSCGEEEGQATLHTSKIVCTDEADLPNYNTGQNGAPTITVNTASDWVAAHDSCTLVTDWEFEWAPYGTGDPGDTLVGPAGGDWTTFVGTTEVPESAFSGQSSFWVREVLQSGYIPFTHEAEGNKNTDDYTAEMYCHVDGLNYDNYERVDGPQAGGDYYCVGWNVPEETPEEYAPYCGDGVINQNWEQCDGTGGCTEQCQYEGSERCTDLTLAKINVENVENTGTGNMTSDLYLGQNVLPIPNNVWFMLHNNGSYANDPDISGYEDVPGLAIQRLTGQLRTVMYGTKTNADEEHVSGDITFWSFDDSVEAVVLQSDNSNDNPGNNRLEGDWTDGSGIGSTNAGDDEAWIDNGTAHFWLTTTTADDGFYTTYSEPVVCEDEPVLGCTDPAAMNYDPAATEDDGSCEYQVMTCPFGDNLLANGSFETPVVEDQKLWHSFSVVPGWTITQLVDGDPSELEIHRGWSGNEAADAAQYVELDGDDPNGSSVRIAQEVTLEDGAQYELRWAFAPRQNTSASENQLSVLLDNVEVASSGPQAGIGTLSQGDWTQGMYQFVADSVSAEVAFEDAGSPQNDEYGTFLDDVVLCRIADPELTDYTLTIEITGDGSGTVSSDEEEGINCATGGGGENVCEMTYEPGTVVDLSAIADSGSNFDSSWTTGAGTCTGNTTPCQVTMNQNIDLVAHFALDDSNGGGGSSSSGGGSSNPRCSSLTLTNGMLEWETRFGKELTISANGIQIHSTDDRATVAAGNFYTGLTKGVEYELTVHRSSKSDTCTVSPDGSTTGVGGDFPPGQVLGAQTSVVPYGAPDAGAGGTSPVEIPTLHNVTAILLRSAGRAAKHG